MRRISVILLCLIALLISPLCSHLLAAPDNTYKINIYYAYCNYATIAADANYSLHISIDGTERAVILMQDGTWQAGTKRVFFNSVELGIIGSGNKISITILNASSAGSIVLTPSGGMPKASDLLNSEQLYVWYGCAGAIDTSPPSTPTFTPTATRTSTPTFTPVSGNPAPTLTHTPIPTSTAVPTPTPMFTPIPGTLNPNKTGFVVAIDTDRNYSTCFTPCAPDMRLLGVLLEIINTDQTTTTVNTNEYGYIEMDVSSIDSVNATCPPMFGHDRPWSCAQGVKRSRQTNWTFVRVEPAVVLLPVAQR